MVMMMKWINICKFSHQALQDYGTILLLSNDDSLTLKALTNRSLLYIEIGDYHNALHDLLWAVRLSPKDKSLHHTLGLCYHKWGSLLIRLIFHHLKTSIIYLK